MGRENKDEIPKRMTKKKDKLEELEDRQQALKVS
jgi:hypothetical protein